MMFRDPLVIDNDIIAFITSDCGVFLEGNYHFLAVFEHESKFCHGFRALQLA